MQNAAHQARRLSARGAIPAAMLAVMIVLAAVLAPARASELWEGKWLEARSPNFVVTSQLSRRTTTRLVQELEDFRTLVGAVSNAGVLNTGVPTHVLVVNDKVPDLGLGDHTVGYLLLRMRANHAAIRPSNGPLGQPLQYLYAYFLISNQSSKAYPSWYVDGLATMLSTADLRNGRFTIGDNNEGIMWALGMPGTPMPYARLVDHSALTKMAKMNEMNKTTKTAELTDRERTAFHAESWALVHYLTFGKPGLDVNKALAGYLVDLERGTAPVAAFESAFHESTATLDKTIREYLDHAHYRKGELNQPFDPGRITVRTLATDEVAARLAKLCWAREKSKLAGTFADAALAANPDNAAALVIHAHLLNAAGKHSEAEALYRKAIALEPDSDLHHLDFGEYWLARAMAAADGTERHDLFVKARSEFYQANKLNDSNPETLAVNGNSYLLEGVDPVKGLPTLELAHHLLPSSSRINMMLAQTYVAVGQANKALALLRDLTTWGDAKQKEAAGKLLASIDSPAGSPGAATAGTDAKTAGGTAARPAPQPSPQPASP